MSQIKKILIFRFGAIGDIVHSTALFRSIKKLYPEISIHYLTGETPSLLLKNDPDLSRVWIARQRSYKYLINLAGELRKEKFDLCINLQPSIRTMIFAQFIRAGKNLIYRKTYKLHAAKNFWITAKPVFKDIILDDELKIYISKKTERKISQLGLAKNVIGFNMGANNARQGRKWPFKHWQELAEKIINKYDSEIVLTGSAEDSDSAVKLLEIFPDIKSFCGELNLEETAALLSKCDIVISGDTGPLHIATAVETYVIGLYGAMPILRTGPYGKNNFAISSDRNCVPCNRRKCKFLKKGESYTPCMEDITSDKVFAVIEEYLTTQIRLNKQ
jgi:ADP-heptose:LPS heptosyltransferase